MLSVVDAWALSPALRELTGLDLPDDAGAALEALDAFSAEHWDFRGGRERNLASSASLTPARRDLVLRLAPELGLAGQERPSRDAYDAIVMTGGMIRAGIVKPRHVAALLGAGLGARHVVFLGGFRPFAGDELALATALGVDGGDEFAAMREGMLLTFRPVGEPRVREGVGATRNGSWRWESWDDGGRTLSVVAAASTDPARRANTADTYRFWAARREPDERSVLLVTTPIYVPYQAAVAVELLGLGEDLAVEAVGVSAAANDLGEHTQPFTAAHHLQELRSAIGGMRSLRRAVLLRSRDV